MRVGNKEGWGWVTKRGGVSNKEGWEWGWVAWGGRALNVMNLTHKFHS